MSETTGRRTKSSDWIWVLGWHYQGAARRGVLSGHLTLATVGRGHASSRQWPWW